MKYINYVGTVSYYKSYEDYTEDKITTDTVESRNYALVQFYMWKLMEDAGSYLSGFSLDEVEEEEEKQK